MENRIKGVINTSILPLINVYMVIMAGGNGTRLWPLSRESNPKQCLALPDETLLEQAVGRAALLVNTDRIWVSTTA